MKTNLQEMLDLKNKTALITGGGNLSATGGKGADGTGGTDGADGVVIDDDDDPHDEYGHGGDGALSIQLCGKNEHAFLHFLPPSAHRSAAVHRKIHMNGKGKLCLPCGWTN